MRGWLHALCAARRPRESAQRVAALEVESSERAAKAGGVERDACGHVGGCVEQLGTARLV